MMQHQERQAIEEDGMQTVLGPEQWRAGGNFGLGPGFVLTLWRGLFLGFDFGVSYSILQGLDRGTGIFDARLSLGWFFTKH
jgi:hypothetical protein